MYICICKGVTDREIVQEVEAGARSIDDVQVKTGCSSQCGKCLFRASKLVQDTLYRQQGINSASLLIAGS
jgi:bacterioferritin-associated ferredoxin